jgi:adenine/guanine phosphoribosyltransferase-like PRPP-binding protein
VKRSNDSSRVVVDFLTWCIVFPRPQSSVFAGTDRAYTSVIDAPQPSRGAIDALAAWRRARGSVPAPAPTPRGWGCVMIRKPGKPPRPVITEDYELESRNSNLEVHLRRVRSRHPGAAAR